MSAAMRELGERSSAAVFRKIGYSLKVLSGGDACGGNTRSHPEHDGEDPCGRWYYAGDGMEEQAAARHFLLKQPCQAGRHFFACSHAKKRMHI